MMQTNYISSERSFWRSSWAVQAAWLLFALLALSLALPGIAPYRRLLEVTCEGNFCLPGQLTSGEAQAVIRRSGALGQYANGTMLVHIITCSLMFLMASALIARKPGQPASVFGAFLLTAASTSTLALALAFIQPELSLAARFIQFIQLATLVPFLSLSPDGRFHPGWLRWGALALVPAAAVSVILPPGSSVSSIVSIAIAALVTTNTMLAYFELARSPKQESAAWTLAAIALLTGAQAIDHPVRLLPLQNTFDNLYNLIGSFIPLFGMMLVVAALTCLAVVLFGDELFRIEVAFNRAIVYGLLSLFVVGGYVLVVGYLSLIFQSSGNLWFSLVATGVIAALFQPLRSLVQGFVNRMIYGEREDPYTVISELGRRLETAIASDEVIPTLLKAIRGALKVSYVAITLGDSEDGTFTITASDDAPTRIALTLHLVYQNETIGWLHIGPRQGETSFSAADRRLLDGFTRQAGAAIFAARQTAELKIARERLVLAQEEERRRIRRDLHDGLGAALAALNMQAGEVQRLMSTDLGNANRRIVELRAGLREAISDIRRLVYGLRPPALDELGLLGALRSRIGSYETGQPSMSDGLIEDNSQPLSLCLEAPEQLPPLPAAVEVAVYRIVEEGLANIVHHAKAKNGLVTISIEHQGLRIEVSDDGAGLSQDYHHGVGLHSMRERTVELGGRWSIQSAAGQGTRVSVWLPLPGEQHRGVTWTKPASLS